MTTNAGAFEMSRPSIGFTAQDHSSDGMEVIRRLFSPEFRNRLDAIIQFAPLEARHDRACSRQVAGGGRSAARAEARLAPRRRYRARAWIAKRGYDPKMGARPMARLIQDSIKRPLAEELLFGRLVDGGYVHVTLERGWRGAETHHPLRA